MRENDRIVLIPGFFGFGAFGEETGSRIAYFEDVVRVLSRAAGIPSRQIRVHEPPPTGALGTRARSLLETVLLLLGEESARGRKGHRPAVHLIGHSTGGVDARLLANERFGWAKMDAGLRRAVLGHIGTVVTLSAPLHGTPIANRFRGPFRLLLDGLSLWSILDRRLEWKLAPGASLDSLLRLLDFDPGKAAPLLKLAGGMDAETAAEIGRFRGLLIGDGRLMDDLTPESMRRLNRRIAGGDCRPLKHYVTVSPRPSPGADAVERRLAYAACYWATESARFAPKAFPAGSWLIGAPDPRLGQAPLANDGVVPATSQALDPRRPSRIVVADHLDVVGHFEGRRGATIFKCGASFGRDEFETLWTDIARAL